MWESNFLNPVGCAFAGNYFRLGEEKGYKSYVNQYSTHQHALSKLQAKEEQEKRTRLSHKFSLTDVRITTFVGVEVSPALRIRDILIRMRIRILGSVPQTNGCRCMRIREAKNIRILRFRMRIRNIGTLTSFLEKVFLTIFAC
jgi:hypothetical protein